MFLILRNVPSDLHSVPYRNVFKNTHKIKHEITFENNSYSPNALSSFWKFYLLIFAIQWTRRIALTFQQLGGWVLNSMYGFIIQNSLPPWVTDGKDKRHNS